ncbi:MAG: hypothetical protein Q9165_004780 [Trypethelium subeluteriae]
MPPRSTALRVLAYQKPSSARQRLTVAFDFGTKTASCAYRLPGAEFPLQSTAQIKQVRFENRCFDIPMMASWLQAGEGDFCWGLDLEKKINSGEVSIGDVLTLPKLQLYEGLQGSLLVQQERAKLARLGKSLDQLIMELLSHLYESCRNLIEEQEGLPMAPDGNLLDVLLCVPQNFSNLQTERISKLAIKAQIPQLRIVSEAECAASYHFQGVLDRMRQDMPANLGSGDVILVGDAGGGTFDGGGFQLEADLDDGATAHILPLPGRLFGELCGSEFINQRFLQWLQKEWRGRISNVISEDVGAWGRLYQLLPQLRISLEHALGQASFGFESCKKDWQPDMAKWSRSLLISGADEDEKITIFLDNKLMRQFFDPVIGHVMDTLMKHCMPDVKYIILTGGLSQSKYLADRAAEVFGGFVKGDLFLTPDNRNHPVACGAILRYQNIAFRLEPNSSVAFGVINANESFDPEDHPDACDKSGKADPDVVKDDAFGRFDEGIVLNRISKWFSLTETDRASEEIYWQFYEPTLDALKMTARICWTSNPAPKDHEPLHDRNGKIREGLHVLTEDFGIDIDPEKYGYIKKEAENGEKYYSVQAAIVLAAVDGMLTFQWYIAKAGEGPWDDDQDDLRSDKEAFRMAELLYEKDHVIHDLRWILRDRLVG